MSDPVSKIEIEDVLSSIRRLVSEQDRVEPRRVFSRQRAEQDRLVLTPALRVAEPDQPDEAAAAAPTDAPPPEDAPWSDPGATLFGTARVAGEYRDDSAAPDAEHDRYVDDFDDDGDDDDAGFDDDAADPAAGTDSALAGPADADDPAGAGTLSAKIHALEAAIGRTADRWEPDDAGLDDYAGTRVETIEWEDHDEASEPVRPAFGRAVAAEDPEAEKPDFLAEDDAFLDEESLRELVADIVREELQGALGERITRNVRKLVRREIHRALAAQELE